MLAETHLDDLQAGVEAGSRQVDYINQLKQADLMGALIIHLRDLQKCVHQQREAMRDLRDDIREMRRFTTNDE